MASAAPKSEISAEKLSNDFLTCPLCYDMYKTPKVLPCQHTFCLLCLRQYVTSRGFACTLPCPMCKEVSAIPQNDVAQLKSNYTIVNLLQCVEDSCKIVSEESPVSLPESLQHMDVCGACLDTKDLISLCEKCSFWLCATCTVSHKRIPATSQHVLKTSLEINETCKRIADLGESSIQEMNQLNSEKTEIILGQIEQLPVIMDTARARIRTAGDLACRLIRNRENELMEQMELFQVEQHNTFSRKLHILEEHNSELSKILGVINGIKISSDGYQNHKNASVVEKDLNNVTLLTDFPSTVRDFQSLSFMPFMSEKSELRRVQLGSLNVIRGIPDQHVCLQDHFLQLHKIATLEEREYISGLAVNKFAEKFVVANNESVFVFQPNCRKPKRFLPFQHYVHVKKPWGIAYSETGKRLYITVAGEHEGEGSIYCYTVDGKEHVVLASGLTLPRGIAVHNDYIYVCDQIDRCVYIFNSDGSIIKLLKKLPDGNFLFNEPMFVAVGADGRIAVSDGYNCVKIFDNKFNLIFTYFPGFVDSELWDVLVLHDGSTVVCDWNHGMHKISRDFKSNGLIAVEGSPLQEPSALASLENGNVIYVGNGMGEICSVI